VHGVRGVWTWGQRVLGLWSGADGTRMGAAMSFYGVLSLAPLLVFLVALLGWWLDRDQLERSLVDQIGTVLGDQGAAVVQQALSSAQQPSQGFMASLLALGVLLFGATGVFGELQSALQRLWSLDRPGKAAEAPWWQGVSLRLRGVAYVMAFGFLLLVSLAVSALLNVLATWAQAWRLLAPALQVINEVAGFAICAALFVGLLRMSKGPKPPLRHLVRGALCGAVLFTVGRHGLALYLSQAAVVSAYGAAGSLVVVLMWIYFSSSVLLLSAACARAWQELDDARGEHARRAGQA
jgi:membrane protein